MTILHTHVLSPPPDYPVPFKDTSSAQPPGLVITALSLVLPSPFPAYPVDKFRIFCLKQKLLKCSLHSHPLPCIIVAFSWLVSFFLIIFAAASFYLSKAYITGYLSHYYLFERTVPKVLLGIVFKVFFKLSYHLLVWIMK